jgi:hypothetical protein
MIDMVDWGEVFGFPSTPRTARSQMSRTETEAGTLKLPVGWVTSNHGSLPHITVNVTWTFLFGGLTGYLPGSGRAFGLSLLPSGADRESGA